MRRRMGIIVCLILMSWGHCFFPLKFDMPANAAAARRYVVIDLGTLGGDFSSALAINNRGQITGFSTLSGDAVDPIGNPIGHAFLYDRGAMIDVGTLGGHTSAGNALNDNGWLVGDSFQPGNPMAYGGFAPHGFAFRHGAITDLGSLGGIYGSSATGVNHAGQIVGQADLPDGRLQAFLYQDGVMRRLPLVSDYSVAYSINDHGLIVGTMSLSPAGTQHAFAYDSRRDQLTDLGTLGGAFAQAISVNAAGWVVGESSLPEGAGEESLHAFLHDGNEMRDLGALPGDRYSSASHVNARGQVVGWSAPEDLSITRGFLWSDGRLQDLNALIPAESGWQICFANGINNLGQIVGVGIKDGQRRAVLLTTPGMSLVNLMHLAQSPGLSHEIANGLDAKLRQAAVALQLGRADVACAVLQAFNHQVEEQAGRALSEAEAARWGAATNGIRSSLGCL